MQRIINTVILATAIVITITSSYNRSPIIRMTFLYWHPSHFDVSALTTIIIIVIVITINCSQTGAIIDARRQVIRSDKNSINEIKDDNQGLLMPVRKRISVRRSESGCDSPWVQAQPCPSSCFSPPSRPGRMENILITVEAVPLSDAVRSGW